MWVVMPHQPSDYGDLYVVLDFAGLLDWGYFRNPDYFGRYSWAHRN